MYVLIETPDGVAEVLIVTAELGAALDRFTPTSTSPKYLRDAWAAAKAAENPVPYQVPRA